MDQANLGPQPEKSQGVPGGPLEGASEGAVDMRGETCEKNTNTMDGETCEKNTTTMDGETCEENANTMDGETAAGVAGPDDDTIPAELESTYDDLFGKDPSTPETSEPVDADGYEISHEDPMEIDDFQLAAFFGKQSLLVSQISLFIIFCFSG